MPSEHDLPEVNAMMKQWGFNEDERKLIIDIGDNTPLLPSLLIGTATVKFTKSLETWTKRLTIFTFILAIATAVQVYLAFCCNH